MVTQWWKRSCLILVVVLGASLMTAVPATAATELKLMTWNARTQGGTWSSVAEHIFDSGADVVALQEVCDSTLDNVEAALESDTGMPWYSYYQEATTNLACFGLSGSTSTSFGNAILVRDGIAVRDPLRVPYPACQPQNDEPRSFVAVTILINGLPVRVLSTHLGRFGDGSACQIPLLVEYARAWQRGVIMGDFNIRSTNPNALVPLVEAGMANAHPPNYFTYENHPDDWTTEPTIKIDHVFTKGIDVVGRDSPDWNEVSDHRALTLTITT